RYNQEQRDTPHVPFDELVERHSSGQATTSRLRVRHQTPPRKRRLELLRPWTERRGGSQAPSRHCPSQQLWAPGRVAMQANFPRNPCHFRGDSCPQSSRVSLQV